MQAYQAVLADVKELGASLAAVSPQLPDNSLSTAEKNALAFEVLSDVGNAVAGEFGLVFRLPDNLRAIYAFVDPDYTRRAEPGAILDAVRRLA